MTDSLAKQLLPLATAYAAERGGAIIKTLGAGGSAAVYEFFLKSELIALKVYDPALFGENNGPAELRRVDLQRGLIGHNCTELIAIKSLLTQHDTCFIEMEFVAWPTLKDVLHEVPEDCVGPLMAQLVDAVRFLDERGIVHRDIKPENILVSKDFLNLKLIDLGVAREMRDDEGTVDGTDQNGRRPFIATAQYSSPEYLFRLQAPSQNLWKSLTVYQLGAVLHDLVMRKPIFESAVITGNKFNVAAAVLRDVPQFQGVSNQLLPFATLSSRCLIKDPALRLRLVSYDSFESNTVSSTEQLRARMARAAQAKRATSDLDQLLRQRDAARKKALETVAQSVKMRLMELLAKGFPIKTFGAGANNVSLVVSLDSDNVVTTLTSVIWDETVNPMVGQVFIRAALNQSELSPDMSAKPIGEIDAAAAGLTVLCVSHVEALCSLVMRAQDLVDVATEKKAAACDLVDCMLV